MYGIDLDDRTLLRARTWRWLRTRILQLLTVEESRLYRALKPAPDAVPNPASNPALAGEQEGGRWRSP